LPRLFHGLKEIACHPSAHGRPAIPQNRGMQNKAPSRAEITPAGQLVEARLQQVIGYQLAQASIVTDEVFAQQVGVPLELRRVEYTLLMLVGENPGCTPARLARALKVTPANISMLIDRVEARGWVRREPHSTDRRSHHLHLTAKASKLAADATRRLVAGEAAALAGLSTGERAILAELLHKLASCRKG